MSDKPQWLRICEFIERHPTCTPAELRDGVVGLQSLTQRVDEARKLYGWDIVCEFYQRSGDDGPLHHYSIRKAGFRSVRERRTAGFIPQRYNISKNESKAETVVGSHEREQTGAPHSPVSLPRSAPTPATIPAFDPPALTEEQERRAREIARSMGSRVLEDSTAA